MVSTILLRSCGKIYLFENLTYRSSNRIKIFLLYLFCKYYLSYFVKPYALQFNGNSYIYIYKLLNPTSWLILLQHYTWVFYQYNILLPVIHGVLGETVFSSELHGEEKITVNRKQLPSGIYNLTISSDKITQSKQFLITH